MKGGNDYRGVQRRHCHRVLPSLRVNQQRDPKIHAEFTAMWPALGWVELTHGTAEGHSLLRVHPDS
jgi:hypothetical protein